MPERDAIAEIRRGVALAVCAVLCFTVMISLVKWLSGWFAPMQIAFFRAFCAMALCLPVLLADSGVAGLRTRQPWSYVLRGLVGCGSIATSFYGVTLVPIADWVALTFMVPLFVAAMSAPLLGESVGWRRWLAILVGFAGILIIVPPTGTASLWALAVGISSQLLVAFALVLIRRMGSGERTTTIVFYYMVGISTITLVLAPLDWRGPQGAQWLWLAAVGFIGGGAHLLITAAYRRAPASVIAPLDYTGIVWAMLIGWLVWHEKPDANLFLGVPLVIGSGLYVVINATRRKTPSPSVRAQRE